ncbi:DUF917 domain-containing protein [Actinomadura kijaniata]|uniref:DUF917 domain-containing protein n=1 Tax=Actinomadura kijaniata TaxID=46161 RepID=UPI00082EB906|nr:DUF917 domain-containing protein [Actinomadura kijaniata]
MELTAGDVADLAMGAQLFGSGGGGRTDAAERMVRRVLTHLGPLPVVAAADLPRDSSVACVGAVGSSTVMVERLPGAEEFVRAARSLERHVGSPLVAVQPLEIGGVNGLLGVAAAAWLGLPLVDGDAMGRAFPRLDQTVLQGRSPVVAAVSDPTGNTAILECLDGAALERVVRASLPALGAWAGLAMHHDTAARYARCSINGSVSRALTLGGLLRRAGSEPGGREAFLRSARAVSLFRGRVLEVRRDRSSERTGGVASVQHLVDPARTLRIEFADEYVLALDDGVDVARVPDIICGLDDRTWRPISVEELAVNEMIEVIRLPAPSRWDDPKLRDRVGLETYGLADFGPDTGADAPAGRREVGE